MRSKQPANRDVPKVDIYTTTMQKGPLNIHIVDNGEGIDESNNGKDIYSVFHYTKERLRHRTRADETNTSPSPGRHTIKK